jgi:threonine/homoserine/homoserine lactone efflux protein
MIPSGVEHALAQTVSETVQFLKGVGVGLAIAIPLGPIGFLCVRRTLVDGPRIGFVSGLGAAFADTLYGAVAAFGVTFISTLMVRESFWVRLVGGAALLVIGVRTLLSAPPAKVDEDSVNPSHLGAFASTFFLTLTNPLTILSFAAIFTGLGLGSTGSYFHALVLVGGVFTGSTLWWLSLSLVAGIFHGRLHPGKLLWVNRISGGIIIALGALAMAGIFL